MSINQIKVLSHICFIKVWTQYYIEKLTLLKFWVSVLWFPRSKKGFFFYKKICLYVYEYICLKFSA